MVCSVKVSCSQAGTMSGVFGMPLTQRSSHVGFGLWSPKHPQVWGARRGPSVPLSAGFLGKNVFVGSVFSPAFCGIPCGLGPGPGVRFLGRSWSLCRRPGSAGLGWSAPQLRVLERRPAAGSSQVGVTAAQQWWLTAAHPWRLCMDRGGHGWLSLVAPAGSRAWWSFPDMLCCPSVWDPSGI